MTMKQLARRLQPLPLYFILGLTVCLFFLELVIAHVTHSLTLLLDAYHILCNIIVLVGSIISIKHGSGRCDRTPTPLQNSKEELKSLASLPNQPQMCSETQPGPERRLRNTFGWARVDVIVMLIGCVFLASLCFSVVVEALQTLVHISHHDEMHAPIPILAVGVVSLVLNLLAYILIGGYTFHQGSFLNRGVEEEAEDGEVAEKTPPGHQLTDPTEKRQGLWGLCRDCVGCVIVVICSVVVFSTESGVAKYVDPLFSILSAVLVLLLSYPFMKESCLILLQTIPDHINIGSLRNQLTAAFPVIVNVHELHVWRLTVDKTYCTAHITFLNPKEYLRITSDISRFFLGQGITHVTLQPEFYKEQCLYIYLMRVLKHPVYGVIIKELDIKDVSKSDVMSTGDCLFQCTDDLCLERHCCASRSPSLESVHVDSHSHSHSHKHKGAAKKKISKCSKPCSGSTGHNEAILQVATSVASELSEVTKTMSAETGVSETPQGETAVSETPQQETAVSETPQQETAETTSPVTAETHAVCDKPKEDKSAQHVKD